MTLRKEMALGRKPLHKLGVNKEFDEQTGNAVLEAVEREKEAAEQIAKQTKTFRGTFGYVLQGSFEGRRGKLVISPIKLHFFWDKSEEIYVHDVLVFAQPYDLKCESFDTARVEGKFIREIHDLDLVPAFGDYYRKIHTGRFKADSPFEAASALEAIREVCKKP